MGKFAQVALVLAQVVVSILGIFFGAAVLPDLVTSEGGDEIARGQRAMAILGSLFIGVAILLGAFAVDMYYHSFMGPFSITVTLLVALVMPFLFYFPLDRRITRREHARAEAAPTNSTKS